MHDVIRLLEKLGNDASYSFIAKSLMQTEIAADSELYLALQEADVAKLESLIGVRNNVVCAIFAPEEEPEKVPEEQPEDEPQPEQEPIEEKSFIATVNRVA